MWYFMESVEKTISKYNLFNQGDVVGVACSGGADSMSLLYYLNSAKQSLGISIVAVTIDHGIRENSKNDVEFVVNYCNKNDIAVLKYSGNVPALAEKNKQTIEQAARDYRYGIFANLLTKKTVTKMALGHHMQDQAETILLNIFRGAGLAGAAGMDIVRDGVYVRPLLKTPKSEIMAYVNINEIPYVEDETNHSNDYARNYVRNQIMPLIRNKWKSADQTICNFGEICKKDNDYINGTIADDGLVLEDSSTINIPVTYFVYAEPAITRIILKAVKLIGVKSDLESKHIELIINLALNSENGATINLPNKVVAIKEYNFVTISNKNFAPKPKQWKFAIGKTDITGFGVLEVKKVRKAQVGEYNHVIDAKCLPKDAVWRYRQEGDMFEKFGGGTKSLSDYLSNKKIPRRRRTYLPVLASGKEVYVIAGVEISNKVKTTESTKTFYGINAVTF